MYSRESGGVQSTFVYQPGGVAAANVFTSWAALYAALNVAAPASANGQRPPTVIEIDDSFTSPAVMPAGTYNPDSIRFVGVPNYNTNSGGAALTLAAGVVFSAGAGKNFSVGFGGTLQVLKQGGAALIAVTGATQEVNIYFDDGAFAQCDVAAAPFVTCTNNGAACTIYMTGNCAVGGGAVTFGSAPAGGFLIVRAFGSAVIAGSAFSGAGATVNFDCDVPSAQGGGCVVIDNLTFVPATPGNWNPAPTLVRGALDQLAAVAANHVQGVQGFTGPAAGAIHTVALAHTTVTGHTRMFATVSFTCATADADCGIQLAIDGVGTGPVMGVSGTLGGDVMTCAIEWDFAPAAGARNYTVLITSGAGGNLTGVQSGVKVQELLS